MSLVFPIHLKRPERRSNIQARDKYGLYKSDLRIDFFQRCGYCDTLDFYSGGVKGFHIDHFAPKKKFSALTNEYSNLIYCCPICNMGKSDDWPSNDAQISYLNDKGYIDPCSAAYHDHLGRSADGKIFALTPLGAYIHKRLKLFLKRRQLCWLIEKMESQMRVLGEIISSNPEDKDRLVIFHRLTMEYLKYTGILKSE